MADFRRCLYALALVALLAGLTVPASAQSFLCTNSTGVPPVVRAEGYSELLGDIVLDCTGGTPTPPNQSVPGINVAVNLDTFVSSQTTAIIPSTQVEFLESLLIIDEPNSPFNPTVPILNCGRTAAPDNLQAGAGVCSILGGGSLGAPGTYNGTAGHPNVFQGRSFRLITGQTNQVVFSGIPIDPPGTLCAATIGNGTPAAPQNPTALCHRIIRITNIRGDASTKGVAQGNQTSTITADLIINPVSGLPVDNPTHVVARVQLGLVGPALNAAKLDFIQCNPLGGQTQNLQFTFREGFNNAFKPQSLTQVLANGRAKPDYNYFGSGTFAVPLTGTPNTTQGVLNNQNVPGAVYDTESGFVNHLGSAGGDAPTNALTGGPGAGVAFDNTGGSATNIALAGKATQGTRLMINFTNIPAGSAVTVPNVINLTNVIGGGITGVAVLITGTSASGFGGTPAATGTTTVAGGAAANRAVYEVFFANPNALEQLAVPLTVIGSGTPSPNLPSNLPAPNIVSQIQGNFAPFYDAANNIRTTAFAAGSENTSATPATLAIPRFQRLTQPVDFFAISRCSCNLLFPFVTNAATAGGNYDTGIAISNTSLDPGNLSPTVYGFKASAQSGPVQFWYYNRNATPAVEPNFLSQGNTQCTNVTTPGSCTGTLSNVVAGGQLLYILSSGGVINGQTPAGPVLLGAPGFTGYMIVQARFQYCHGFAYISKQGAGFQADNTAMGYLALVLDQPSNLVTLPRTSSNPGEMNGH